MLKVVFVPHPLRIKSRAIALENVLLTLTRSGGTILHITSDSKGYTIVYSVNKSLNG